MLITIKVGDRVKIKFPKKTKLNNRIIKKLEGHVGIVEEIVKTPWNGELIYLNNLDGAVQSWHLKKIKEKEKKKTKCTFTF